MSTSYLNIIALAGLLFLAPWAPAEIVAAGSDSAGEQCLACHNDVWLDAQNKRYVHKPVAAADCRYCHAALRGAKDAVSHGQRQKINWVVRGRGVAQVHWLEFDQAKRGATLVVEARWQGSQIQSEVALPPFAELEELPADHSGPPRISNLRVLEVVKGIFLSATLGWETDKPADSQVEYGLAGLNQKSMLDRQLTREHVVTLTGVESGKTYKYRVLSRDLAGQLAESPLQTLVVKPVAAVSRSQATLPAPSGPPKLSISLYRRGEMCLVKIEGDREIQVQLGLLPKKYEENVSLDGVKVIRHVLLNSQEVTSIGICYTCHTEYQKILTHPINVYPKPGMSIPPEYNTLADGRITCMSCHATHASNVEFRVIKANKRELCRGCHRDML